MEDEQPQQDPRHLITPVGTERLRQELEELKYKERPQVTKVIEWAAGNGDRSENGDYIYGKKRLREIDSRIRFLSERLKICVVVDPLSNKGDTITFGATVTLLDDNGNERTFVIVGVDEVDVNAGRISYRSPLGRALERARAGDLVEYQSPKGTMSVEVLSFSYIPVTY